MKKFKIAHIVPVSHLYDTLDNQYHMCLAHLVECTEYREHFASLTAKGKFVLMDNGAAEGCQLKPEELFDMYELIQPTEIVLPDTLFDPASTIQKSRQFLVMMENVGVYGKYRTMAVPQGNTLDEWIACARIFIKDRRINSFGISKFLNVATGDRYVRFKACQALAGLIAEYGRDDLEVHLLGCDEGPLVVKMCQEAFPFVRGCDSAFAYLQAQKNKMMSLQDDSRPSGTIDFIDGPWFARFGECSNNFNQFAGLFDNGDDESWTIGGKEDGTV